MKKIYIKAFSLLFSAMFIISSACATGIKVLAQNNKNISYPFGYSDADKFAADMLRMVVTNNQKQKMSVENYAYKITIRQYTYKIMAEGIIDDKWLMGESVFWKNAGKCLDSDFVNLVTWKQTMYESLIMDWLKYQFESEEFKSEFAKSTAEINWKIIEYLSEKIDIYSKDDLENMSVEKAQELLDDDFYNINDEFAKYTEWISIAGEIATTGFDYYNRVSEAMAVQQACNEKIQFLGKVWETTKDKDLKNAISVVIQNLNQSLEQIVFDESAEIILEKFYQIGWDMIIKEALGDGTNVSLAAAAVKLEKTGIEWIFNQDNAATARIELTVLYMINQSFADAYKEIRSDYEGDTSSDKAVSLIDGYLNYTNYQAYASEKSKNYIAQTLLEGAKNKVCNLFPNKHIQMYEDINEMLDGDIDVTKKYYNQVGRFYDMYHNTLVKLNHLEASLVDDEPGPLNIPDSAVEYNGHYYYLCCNNEAEDYATAENYCKEQGGYLATITSEKENKFLFNYVREKGYSSAYFGLNNLKDGKAYQWNNGELLIYTKWAKNEPDNTFSDYGYYVRFNENAKDGTWKVDTFSGGETNFNNVFLCEWGDYSVTGNDGLKVTSKKRDIVLTLDISASMDGIPLDETKKAAAKFVDSILNKNSNIGLVSYSDEATSLSGICSNDVFLKNTITSLSSAENTNIEDGLSRAYSMLQLGQSKKKLIVLMSDGLPTLGKDGEELIKYAEKIKDQGVLIYTLGFFQNTEEYKAEGQYLMEKIASEGCHYEVSSSEDLVFFFEDVAGQIGGQKYIYVKVACPVDVSVTYKGETLSSAENDQNLRTSFGTLSFRENEGKENNEEESSGYSNTYLKEADSKVKILRLKEGTDYNIKINGTGDGEMDYTIGFVNDEGEYNDLRRFEDIDINKDTVIDTVANTSKKTLLNIDEDGDGKYDLKLQAGVNGYGEEVKIDRGIYIILAYAFISALIITIIVRRITI